MASDWPLDAWDPGALRARVSADKEVRVRVASNGNFDDNVPDLVEARSMSFEEACRLITSDTGYQHYIQQLPLDRQWSELGAITHKPALLDPTKIVVFRNLWFGGKGCRSPLHHDFRDNFLVQLSGTKRVLVCDPSDSEYLYPAVDAEMQHLSRVDIFSPDESEFPLLSRATIYEVVLRAGDVLYLPPLWWHATESLTVSVSVNFWWIGALDGLTSAIQLGMTREGRALLMGIARGRRSSTSS
jgi:lysine-specific demethylase 8